MSVVLLDYGLGEALVPSPVGIKSKDLVDRVIDAVDQLVGWYEVSGGVLLARRFATRDQVSNAIMREWDSRFVANNIEMPKYAGLSKEELNRRLAVAAQVLVMSVFEEVNTATSKALYKNPDGSYTIRPEQLEHFCMKATRVVHHALIRTDHDVHRLIHGSYPAIDSAEVPGEDPEKD